MMRIAQTLCLVLTCMGPLSMPLRADQPLKSNVFPVPVSTSAPNQSMRTN